MTTREQLIAYLATLGALVAVFLGSLAFAAWGSLTNLETFGIGTVTGGLIGILRLPQSRQVTVENTQANPVPVDDPEARDG